MPKWKLKIKGSGTPPVVPSGGGSKSFNSPDGQQVRGSNASGMSTGYPDNSGAPAVKKRAHFPRPRSRR
jgi:hypothetical protein